MIFRPVTSAPGAASNESHKPVRRFFMAKVFTIPVMPDPRRRKDKQRSSDPRYIEGQRLLMEAMKYLAQNPEQNKDAVLLLSEHFRTRFRMSDRPGESVTMPKERE